MKGMALTAAQKANILKEFMKHMSSVTPAIPSERLQAAIVQFTAFLETVV